MQIVMRSTNPVAGEAPVQSGTAEAACAAGAETRTMAEVLADAANEAGTADTSSMTLSEYRSFIMDRISEIPIDSSQALASITVHITDEGLAAMQEDPEYEAWVLDSLRYDFAFNDPWSLLCGGSYHVHTFGATKEEYHGEGWFPGYMGGQGDALYQAKSEGYTWQRVTPKKAASRSSSVQEDLASRLRLERLMRKMALARMDFQSDLLEQASKHRQAVEEANRTGRRSTEAASPIPQFHGVPAALLMGMIGLGAGSM